MDNMSQSQCDVFFDHAVSFLQYSARMEGEVDDWATDYIEQLEALLRGSNRLLCGILLSHLSDSSLTTADASHVASFPGPAQLSIACSTEKQERACLL